MPSGQLEAGGRAHRGGEFFKGFFIPLAVSLPCVATYLPVEYLIERFGWHSLDNSSFLLAAVVVISTAALLARRWWQSAPERARGVVVGAILTPVILFGIFIAWLVIGGVQTGPR